MVEAAGTSPVFHLDKCHVVTPSKDDADKTDESGSILGPDEQKTAVALTEEQVKLDVSLNERVDHVQVQAVKRLNAMINSTYYYTGLLIGKVYKVSRTQLYGPAHT